MAHDACTRSPSLLSLVRLLIHGHSVPRNLCSFVRTPSSVNSMSPQHARILPLLFHSSHRCMVQLRAAATLQGPQSRSMCSLPRQ